MTFHLLAGYARFLLEYHLDELVEHNLRWARQIELPLLQLFSQYSEEQLLTIHGKTSGPCLLTSHWEWPFRRIAAANAKETLSNAIRLIGELNTGADPGKLSDLRRAAIIKLYMILRSVPASSFSHQVTAKLLCH
jgi:hypothetical protein